MTSQTKTIEIFRAGTHTAMDGRKIDFTEEMLKASAAAYSPTLHEAPAVIGHPKHNLPAYGWAKSLGFTEGKLVVALDQVDPAFAEMVTAGRFKKISASFYHPDADNNPVPGTYYLRHVGFLGAQPPAVKGLKDAAFADGEPGVIEFGDEWTWSLRGMARIARGWRDWIISEKGLEVADKIIPSWEVDSLDDAAVRAEAKNSPSYSENPNPEPAEADPLKVEDLNKREADIAAREASFAEKTRAQRAAADASLVSAMVAEGRLAPGAKDGLVAFMASLDAEGTVQFGEGAGEQSPHAFFTGLLAQAGKLIDFGERSKGEGGEGDALPADPGERGAEIGKRAVEFIESERAAGRTVTAQQAVAHVTKTTQEK